MSIVTKLDAQQAIRKSFDDAREALKTLNLGGTLVPEDYDEIALTYVASGNGQGEIETVTYKKATVTIGTLTLSYNGSSQLVSVVRT